jgi:hypothetical protein
MCSVKAALGCGNRRGKRKFDGGKDRKGIFQMKNNSFFKAGMLAALIFGMAVIGCDTGGTGSGTGGTGSENGETGGTGGTGGGTGGTGGGTGGTGSGTGGTGGGSSVGCSSLSNGTKCSAQSSCSSKFLCLTGQGSDSNCTAGCSCDG